MVSLFSTRPSLAQAYPLKKSIKGRYLVDQHNIPYLIAGSPFANTGTRAFTPPAKNGDGVGDWVLVLEAGSPPRATAGRR